MPPVRRSVLAGGHTIAFEESGPTGGAPVVLLHGLASDSGTWDRAAEQLAARGLHVFAVDLLGHGRSDKPVGTYLLDAFAESLQAFFDAVGLTSATVGGHSLGGAVAVYFTLQHPASVDRLVLVSAGGLGREVHPLLRAASLPVAPVVLRLAMRPGPRRVYRSRRLHRAFGLTPDNLVNLRRAGRALRDADGQRTFLASLRGVIEPRGQRGSFIEMDQLDPELPTMIVWNAGDPVIPVAHAHAARAHLPASRLVVFEEKGHEPHRRNAKRFAEEVASFIAST